MLDEISQLLTRLNKYFSSPVCSKELSLLSKLVQQYSQAEKEIESAGMLAKRGLKKQLEQIQLDIKHSEEKCLDCIFKAIVDVLKPELNRQADNIVTVAPQASNSIREINLPLTAELNAINAFLNNLERTLENSKTQVKELCMNILEENKSKTMLYSDLVKLDSESLKTTKNLNEEILSTYDPQGLINTYFEDHK